MKYVYFGFSLAILTAFTTPSVYGPPPPPASPEEVHAKIVVDQLPQHTSSYALNDDIEKRAIHAASQISQKHAFIPNIIMDDMEKTFTRSRDIGRRKYPIGKVLDVGWMNELLESNKASDPKVLSIIEHLYSVDRDYGAYLDLDLEALSNDTLPDLEEVSGTYDE
ncbi:hypothetical protein [Candidatus Hepatobacter penaei]|uniref:hypothetical protein n=1 Tax=Candidatus Hepatobacter penaei TaxID=1274402 RepID=UPI0004F2BE9B|nr:hypothetical protein [Candidatus Hepatobacter penaei]